MPRATDNSVAAYDAATRIRPLWRAKRYAPRDAERVRATINRYPRSPEVAVAAGEYCLLRSCVSKSGAVLHRAMQLFRRAVRLDPTHARAWEDLAAVLDIKAQYADAALAALKAIKYGDDPDAVAILARVRAQQGKKAESRRLAAKIARSRSAYARDTSKEVRRGEWDPN
jgi:tetratricopeptide (TPR) repeat protein